MCRVYGVIVRTLWVCGAGVLPIGKAVAEQQGHLEIIAKIRWNPKAEALFDSIDLMSTQIGRERVTGAENALHRY